MFGWLNRKLVGSQFWKELGIRLEAPSMEMVKRGRLPGLLLFFSIFSPCMS